MKTQYHYIAGALLLAATATACREEHLIGEGEGKMMLETSIQSDMKVVSRALSAQEQNELCNSALIWISDPSKGLLYRYDGLSSFPKEGLPLTAGTYAAEAWVGDSVPASWDKKRYRGYELFDITRGGVTNVELTCPIRNTVVSVRYGDKVAEVLSDLTLTVSLNDGITDGTHSLTFEGMEPEKGYYMLNSRTEGFTWTLEGTQLNGSHFSKTGEYKDPSFAEKPFLAQTTEYIFNITYDMQGEVEIGGAYFSIDVEPEPVEGEGKDVLVALAPEIKGSGFDLGSTIIAEPGAAEPQSVVITASSALERVEISGSLLEGAALPHTDYELIGMEETHTHDLAAKGMMIQTFRQIEGSEAITNLRIVMEEGFFNSIPQGDYQMNITATDTEGQTSQATFSISLNDAPVIAGEVDEETQVSYTSATLSATVKDPASVSRLGFEVKKIASSRSFEDWTFVEGTLDGSTLTLSLTGLEDGTTYAWRVVADDFATKEQTFTTPSYPQFPNSGFEDWTTEGGGYAVAYAAGGTKFWDSGNQGAWSLNQNVTTADSEVKHSGSYSAKLESKRPSFLGIGKFAAGNIFIGQYLYTDGTDGELGWGRQWDAAPKALKGYIKYKPVTIDKSDSKDVPAEYKIGDMDRGIIYIALLDDQLKENTRAKKEEERWWPVIVKTKSQELFSKDDPNVLAYGEKIFTATDGEGMVEFEIPIETIREGKVAYIMCTASASKGGDYFTGGVGSTMWIDDLQLVY